MANDELFEQLRRDRDRAKEYMNIRKQALDRASAEKDSFQPEFIRLQREQSEANDSMRSCQNDAASYRKSRNHDMARYYSGKADNYRSTLNSIRGERERLIQRQREANTGFQNALGDYRRAKGDFNNAKAAFERRRDELKEQNARERQARHDNRAKDIVKGAFVAGTLAFNVHAAYQEPQQNSGNTQEKWGDSSLEQKKDDRSRQLESGTLDHGNKTTWTSEEKPKD